jgi:prepilin-type N-terminal cleavage/methylation domain-containing protein
MTRRGTTLIELLVTTAILGIIAGVCVLAIRRFPPADPNDPEQILADSLRVAVATGRTIFVDIQVDSTDAHAAVRPDGSIVADTILKLERFTGLPADATK